MANYGKLILTDEHGIGLIRPCQTLAKGITAAQTFCSRNGRHVQIIRGRDQKRVMVYWRECDELNYIEY